MNRKPNGEPTHAPIGEAVDVTDEVMSTSLGQGDPTTSGPVTAAEASNAIDSDRSVDSLMIYRVIEASDAAAPFDGSGSDKGGRWTSPGTPAVYASFSAATALLEFIAHLDENTCPGHVMMAVARMSRDAIETPSALPADWNERPYRAHVRRIGDSWARMGRAMALRVPSALCPSEFNVILNPRHPQFAAQLTVARLLPLCIDHRLRF